MRKIDENIGYICLGDLEYYQVKISRKKAKYSKTFSFSCVDSKKDALCAARKWRDEKISLIGFHKQSTHGFFTKSRIEKKTVKDKVGVYKRTASDTKCPHLKYIDFIVSWYDIWDKGTLHKPKKMIKSFWVGNINVATKQMMNSALTKACLFRKAYENCLTKNKVFNPISYDT